MTTRISMGTGTEWSPERAQQANRKHARRTPKGQPHKSLVNHQVGDRQRKDVAHLEKHGHLCLHYFCNQ